MLSENSSPVSKPSPAEIQALRDKIGELMHRIHAKIISLVPKAGILILRIDSAIAAAFAERCKQDGEHPDRYFSYEKMIGSTSNPNNEFLDFPEPYPLASVLDELINALNAPIDTPGSLKPEHQFIISWVRRRLGLEKE